MTVTVKDKSEEIATLKAAGKLGITAEELEHRVVSRGNGLFGMFGKYVVIEAWKRDQISNKNLLQQTTKQAQRICSLVSPDMKLTSRAAEGRFLIEICDPDLTDSKALRFAESLEHILRKAAGLKQREQEFPIFIDVNGQRQAREEELRQTARKMSTKVIRTKKPITLNFNSAYDRKIIHLTLDGNKQVSTKSVGQGLSRKIMILPAPGL